MERQWQTTNYTWNPRFNKSTSVQKESKILSRAVTNLHAVSVQLVQPAVGLCLGLSELWGEFSLKTAAFKGGTATTVHIVDKETTVWIVQRCDELRRHGIDYNYGPMFMIAVNCMRGHQCYTGLLWPIRLSGYWCEFLLARIEGDISACCVILGLTPDNRCGTIYAAGKFSWPKYRAN